MSTPPTPEPTEPGTPPPAAQTGAAGDAEACPDACRCEDNLSPQAVDPGWHQAARRARALSWFSLGWMTGEGVIGLVAGAAAGSIALIGWALGSVIEGLASLIVIWRLSGSRTLSETAEARAQKGVAISFFLLAPYIAVESIRALLEPHEAAASPLTIILAASSLLVMPARRSQATARGATRLRGDGR